MRGTTTVVIARKGGGATQPGIDQPEAEVWQAPEYVLSGDQSVLEDVQRTTGHPVTIILKVPGHNYWSGRGQSSYAGAQFKVITVTSTAIAENGRVTIRGSELVDFPASRKRTK